MSIIPQPHREADLILGGASQLQQGLGAIDARNREDARLNQELPAEFQEYIKRVMAGEDPAKVGAEARSHPNIAKWIDGRLKQGGQPSPAGYVPDVGPGGISAPGSVSPSGAQNPAPAQSGQSLGAMGGPPPQQAPQAPAPAANYASHQQSLAAMGAPPQFGQVAPGGVGAQDVMMRGQMVKDVPGQDAMIMNAQPIQGPPVGSAGAQALPPSPPQQAAPQGAQPAAGRPGGRPYTVRDMQWLGPLLPTMEAGASRRAVATTAADARRDVEALRAEKGTLVAVMRENGLNDRAITETLLKLEGLDAQQQRAALHEVMATERAKIGAGASVRSAGIRADAQMAKAGPESSDEKELRNLESAIAKITSVTDWQLQPGAMDQLKQFATQHDALAKKLGKPYAGGSEQAAPAQGQVVSPPKPKAAAAPQKPKAQAGAIVRSAYSKSQDKTYHFDAAGNVVKTTPGRGQ